MVKPQPLFKKNWCSVKDDVLNTGWLWGNFFIFFLFFLFLLLESCPYSYNDNHIAAKSKPHPSEKKL